MNVNQHKKIAGRTIATVITFSVASLAFILSVESVCAVGFRLPNQDPEAIARGDAFTATADDPAAIYYNPAGITQLPGIQASAGLYVISADTSFTSSTPGANGAKSDTTPQLVPQLYATYTLTNLPLSFGLGVYAPYGLSLNYGNNSAFSTAAEQGSLLYATINPVVAWKVTPTLSIAIGPDLSLSELELQQSLGTPALRFNYQGEGWDAGYNAGILWQPVPMWAFGVNYRSSTSITYHGKSGQNIGFPPSSVPASVTVPFPEYITGGISFRPTPKWNFEFDLDWTKWSEVQSATISSSPFGPVPPLKLDFQNSFIYEFGVTRQLWDGYFASVGYEYSENSSPSADYNPLIPDANLSLGGVGVGHHGQRWDWMAAFQFAYGTRTVSGDTQNGGVADGNYRTFNKALNLSATYKF
jgi:long-chain fatty acid transport protein